MTDLSKANPTGRFSGLAELYAKHRPSYPDDAIAFILERCQLSEGSVLVDVGSGTGISSRLFAQPQYGLQVLGVEPNPDMRAQAESEITDDLRGRLSYVDGQAESTGLPAESADAVLCAQSFHWFKANSALAEFHRILKPKGWVVLMWNERDDADQFTREYGTLFRTLPGTLSIESERGRVGEALLQTELFDQGNRTVFSSRQTFDEDGLVGRAFSASYAPKDKETAESFEKSLRNLFSQFEKNGYVNMIYETSVYTGRKSD